MKFSVLGPGRWGTFIAWYLDKQKNDVILWGRPTSEQITKLQTDRTNEYVSLPETIELSTDLEYSISSSDYIIISISAQGLRGLMETIKQIEGYKTKNYILCMKGIEKNTGKRLSTIMTDSGVDKNNVAVWVGPGHIQAFVAGVPSVMIIDSYNKELSKNLVVSLRSELIRFYQGEDIVGTEIGAAAKNVMGIAAGLLDGMGFSTLKGGLMARGTREVSRLIKACGGNEMSAYGLCHLGDYEATLFSEYSHNRKWGETFAQNKPFEKLAEGVDTSSAMLTMAETVGVELPITKVVNDVINNKITKKEAIAELFKRDNIKEF